MNLLWNVPTVIENTIFSHMSNFVAEFAKHYSSKLPNINRSKTLMCFSDYSGEEVKSRYFVYSFLIIDGDNLKVWDEQRRKIRESIIADGRRVSFKNLRDKVGQKFVEDYLKLADQLNGFLITVAISKDIKSIFQNDSPIDLSNPAFLEYTDWTEDSVEKAFRVIHILSLFIAGLSSEYQDVIWITDNDKIAANDDRLDQLTKLFAYVSTYYLNHSLGHLRVGRTQSDDGTRLIEDLCSIPDFAAGAYSDQLKSIGDFDASEGRVFWLYSPTFKNKTKDLTWWLTTANKTLCRLCFRIERTEDDTQKVSFYHFFNRD